MYKNLTDAEFANVRVIETTGMGEGVLYRGSSPINDAVEGRNPYADAAAKAAGIKTFINLADSEAAAKAYPGWEGSYYSTQDAVFLNMPVAFTTDAFKTGLANGSFTSCAAAKPPNTPCSPTGVTNVTDAPARPRILATL